MRFLSLFTIGLAFACGLAISGMTQPVKVINFLDVFGTWDPSLAFVLGSALASTFFGYRVVLKNTHPLLATKFELPSAKHIDVRLVTGAVLFGIGWGISGLCPGSAIAAIGTGRDDVLLFAAAMFAGFFLKDAFDVLAPRIVTATRSRALATS